MLQAAISRSHYLGIAEKLKRAEMWIMLMQGSLEDQVVQLSVKHKADMRTCQVKALEATVSRALLSSIAASICSAAAFLLPHQAALQPLLCLHSLQQQAQPAATSASCVPSLLSSSRSLPAIGGQSAATQCPDCTVTCSLGQARQGAAKASSADADRKHRPCLSPREWQVMHSVSCRPQDGLNADLLAESTKALQRVAVCACSALLDSRQQVGSLQSVLQRAARHSQQQAAELEYLQKQKVGCNLNV